MNAALILQLLIEVIAQAGVVAQALADAQAKGVDITSAQLDEVVQGYADARAKLDAALANLPSAGT